MKRKPTVAIDASDAELFREAIGEVRLLAAEQPSIERPKPSPEPRMRRRDEIQALQTSRQADAIDAQLLGDEPLSYRQPHLPERMLRQLRRGHFSVQDEIDLHLLNARDAENLLKRFLAEAIRERRSCVRIIHGKGLRSEAGPVLKGMVDNILRHHGHVLAFSSAPAAQGGTGAVLALVLAD